MTTTFNVEQAKRNFVYYMDSWKFPEYKKETCARVNSLPQITEDITLIRKLYNDRCGITVDDEANVKYVVSQLIQVQADSFKKTLTDLVDSGDAGMFDDLFNYLIRLEEETLYGDELTKRRNSLYDIVFKLYKNSNGGDYKIPGLKVGGSRKSRGRRSASPTRRKKSKSRRSGRKSPRRTRRRY